MALAPMCEAGRCSPPLKKIVEFSIRIARWFYLCHLTPRTVVLPGFSTLSPPRPGWHGQSETRFHRFEMRAQATTDYPGCVHVRMATARAAWSSRGASMQLCVI